MAKVLAILIATSIIHRVEIIKQIPVMLLSIKGLSVSVFTEFGWLKVLRELDLDIEGGEIYGLCGESGCGKTVTALSILRLLGENFRIDSGSIVFDDMDLLSIPEKDMSNLRGKKISMVFQEPMTALNPVLKIGEQISEMFKYHLGLSDSLAKSRSLKLLEEVGFEDPETRYHQYPHQLSGGQRQRILIAFAISLSPKLLICDEPTTALDVASEWEIIALIKRLVEKRGTSVLFITHNLRIVKSICDRVGIMYLGRIVEEQKKEDFFSRPLHPYSMGLLNSLLLDGRELRPIPGSVPDLLHVPDGCKFHPRCGYSMEICRKIEPGTKEVSAGKKVRCFLYGN